MLYDLPFVEKAKPDIQPPVSALVLQPFRCGARQDKPCTDVYEPGSPAEKHQTMQVCARVRAAAHQDGAVLETPPQDARAGSTG